MPLLSGLKKWTLKAFNIPYWMGWSEIKRFGGILSDVLSTKSLKAAIAQRQETFDMAVNRLQLQPKDIDWCQKQFLLLCGFFLLSFFCAFFYMVYLWIHHLFMAGFIMLGVSVVLLSYAFRYHFWWFQVKNRYLGHTFSDWKQFVLKGKISKDNG